MIDQKAIDLLLPEYHPMVHTPTMAEVEKACATEEGRAKYANFLAVRAKRIKAATEEDGDPYRSGWYLEHWKAADRDLKQAGKGQYIGGGKRSSKSERAAWLVVKSLMNLPRTKLWAMQGNMTTSIAEQQPLVWKYLPKEIKRLNGQSRKAGVWHKVDYNRDRGFANNVLVLPNQSELHFLSYSADPREYQGWKLGCPINRELQRVIDADPMLHNLGVWLDEDATLAWFETVELRCASNNSKWLFTFSPMEGFTPTVQYVRGTPTPIETRRAELLPDNRVHVPGIPPGHMPVREKSSRPGVSIVYFWSEFNPFPPNYENVKANVLARSEAAIKQDAYGYGSEVRGRVHPKFGAWNIVKESDLPEEGTNYQVVDLAGSRLWFAIWLRVTPGNPPTFYIYRDWPSRYAYGEWAVMSPTNSDPDGVQGPAQASRGYGFAEYKRMWLQEERIHLPTLPPELAIGPDAEWTKEQLHQIDGLLTHADPMRRALAKQAVLRRETGSIQEPVFERFIDPRAGKDQKHAGSGVTTPIAELAKEQPDRETGATVPGLLFRQAPGLSIDTGINVINELLNWNQQEPLCPVTNEPRLYVSERCEQVIGCLTVYTGLGGEKGGWKDVHDVVRYGLTANLIHIPEGAQQQTPGEGGH